ncbi:MAG TPA: 2,3-bisphosphoglycerate-independent phosphoglycerate mutase, partial [Polyangiaceae bacterium]|nr:2,3-bisphosphoglycerate-independent phosphoglycerate mutase [Polyangiaceae bacterium]
MTRYALDKHPSFPGVQGPVLVVVMDGVGIGEKNEGNAVWLARTPVLDALGRHAQTMQLRAHGTAVGLPSDADMGNSEVGHNALGAGRVFDQGAKLVNGAFADGSLFAGECWNRAIQNAKDHAEAVHFIGLLSDGNVHSHIDHLLMMLQQCDVMNVEKVRVHALLDGRDVPQTSALTYVEQLETKLAQINAKPKRDYRVASGGGRMVVTMDRYEAEWPMVARGWQLHVRGEGRGFKSLSEAVKGLRDEDPGITDQFLPGFVIVGADGKPVGPIRDGASVIFFNFRGDRGIEISRAFEDDTLTAFDRGERPKVFYCGMMQYDGDLKLPSNFLVSPPAIADTMGEYLVHNDKRSFACSETQKYGHVTYFWNGNRSGKFDDKRESYVEIPSDTVPFEQRPWMKASEITDVTIEALKSGKFDFLRINYANGDMVGHTGFLESAVCAVQAVDLQLGRLMPVIKKLNGAMIVTADHGNADEMFEVDKKGAFATLEDG